MYLNIETLIDILIFILGQLNFIEKNYGTC